MIHNNNYMLSPELSLYLDDITFSEYIPKYSENVVEFNPLPPVSAESEEIFFNNCVEAGILVKKIRLVK